MDKFKKYYFLILILIGGAFGAFLGSLGLEFDLGTSLIKLGLYLIISLVLAINIHEIGHFAFGKVLGYKLVYLKFGPIGWVYENGSYKFQINKFKEYAGACAMIPPEDTVSKNKQLLYYLGGISFNLISGILGIIVFGFTSLKFPFIAIFSAFSILVGVINLLPLMSGNSASDGLIVWNIILKKPEADKFLLINELSRKLSYGVRPKELDLSGVDLNLDKFDFTDTFILIYSYFRELDFRNFEKIDYYIGLMESNIDKISELIMPVIYYELCFYYSNKQDKDKADKYYQDAGKILQNDRDVNSCRVKAYYEYYINKDTTKALEYANMGISVADKYPLKGQAVLEEELLKELIDIIG